MAKFQVLLGKYWQDLSDEDHVLLASGLDAGIPTVRLKQRGQDYEVSFARMEQRNLATGRCRLIRPPQATPSADGAAAAASAAEVPVVPLCYGEVSNETLTMASGSAASSAAPEVALCAQPGCGKPTWNGAPGEFCTRTCRARALVGEAEAVACQEGLVAEAFECPCCMEGVPAMTGLRTAPMPKPMGCDHAMCPDCFKRLVAGQIEQKELCVCPMCPETKAALIPSWLVGRTLGRRFAMAMADIEQLNLVRVDGGEIRLWQCPTPDCKNRQVMPSWWDEKKITDKRRMVKCTGCNKKICLRCRTEEHAGFSCQAYQKWKKANDAGEKSYAEMLKYGLIKPCPNCSAPILKNEGCNFMTCASCKSPNGLCWQTGKPRHGSGNCGGGHNCH